MTSKNCPHCGAAADKVRCPGNDNWYACGTMESDPKDRGGKCYRNEIAILRSHNRDLQKAYDHVLECEQNRCREVVELQDQLKEVTAERDEERENSRILRASRDEETAIADSWMRKCNELEQQLDEMKKHKELDEYHILKLQRVLDGSTKRHRQKRETINGLQQQLDELRRRMAEAPVWYMENGGFVSEYAASFRTDKQRLTRVRLVRDDQPGEANA